MIQNEVAILRKVKHPNIIELKEEFNSHSELYLVMELVKVCPRFYAHLYECTIALPSISGLELVAMLLALAKCKSFYVKVFYVMGKVLIGELSCLYTGLVIIQPLYS